MLTVTENDKWLYSKYDLQSNDAPECGEKRIRFGNYCDKRSLFSEQLVQELLTLLNL